VKFIFKPEQLAGEDDNRKPLQEPSNFQISVGGDQREDKNNHPVSTTPTIRA